MSLLAAESNTFNSRNSETQAAVTTMRANLALATAAALLTGCSGVLGAALEKQNGTPGKPSLFSHSSSSGGGGDDGDDDSSIIR